MPCDSIQTNRVRLDFSSVDMLEKALVADGFTVERMGNRLSFYDQVSSSVNTWLNGELNYVTPGMRAGPGVQSDFSNRINRAYSRQVVKETAAKMAWRLEMKNTNQYVATRRGL